MSRKALPIVEKLLNDEVVQRNGVADPLCIEAAAIIKECVEALLAARDYVEDISRGIPLRGTGFEETAKEDLRDIDATLAKVRP